jgi:4-hydroxy-2-oxoheptanedioate aldolase
MERSNKLKARIEAGKVALNGWLGIPSGFSAEVMARSGWHSVTVDLQHGCQDFSTMVQCFQAASAFDVTTLARVPWNEPGIIGKVLDAGAWGVICPMVETGEQARDLVRASLYPPLGGRSNGPFRANMYGRPGASYQSFANEEMIILPMIETRKGVENMQEILDVPGISGLYVGPSDLGLSYGLAPAFDREEDEILRIYERLIAESKARGLFCGLHNGTADYAGRMALMGFQFLSISSDATILGEIARSYVARIRASANGLAD